MRFKNKFAEFGIYILSVLSLLTIISLISVIIWINYKFVSVIYLDSWLRIMNFSGIIIPFLTFIVGLVSLFYKPRKLAVFLVLTSFLMCFINFWKVVMEVIS